VHDAAFDERVQHPVHAGQALPGPARPEQVEHVAGTDRPLPPGEHPVYRTARRGHGEPGRPQRAHRQVVVGTRPIAAHAAMRTKTETIVNTI
jgi:hypothetical protein